MQFHYPNLNYPSQYYYSTNGPVINNNVYPPYFNFGSNTMNHNSYNVPNMQNFLEQAAPRKPVEIPKVNQSTEMPTPILQNIVCTVNLGCLLDLKQISLKARNSEYNPKRFSAVTMRIRVPRTTALIFSSGKVVCTGAKSEDEAKQASRKFARIIQKLGFNVSFKGFQIQNIVASCDIRFPISLEAFNKEHGEFTTYEPETFPGLVYRLLDTKVIILVFTSGKVVLTGAKFKNQIDEAFKNIYPILFRYRKILKDAKNESSKN